MSFPPKYQRLDDVESNPTYSDTLPEEIEQLDGSNVTYTFIPRWPVRGEEGHALGKLGRSRVVSTALQIFLCYRIMLDSFQPQKCFVTGSLHSN